MEYETIMAQLAAYKANDLVRFAHVKTVKEGIHLYEFKGVPVRVLYVSFNEKTGLHRALVRRHKGDTWTTCSEFEKGGTEGYAQPDELTPLPNEWDEDAAYDLTRQACYDDSMSKRREAQGALEAMFKKTVPYIDTGYGFEKHPHDDVTGWPYDTEAKRLVRPWEVE